MSDCTPGLCLAVRATKKANARHNGPTPNRSFGSILTRTTHKKSSAELRMCRGKKPHPQTPQTSHDAGKRAYLGGGRGRPHRRADGLGSGSISWQTSCLGRWHRSQPHRVADGFWPTPHVRDVLIRVSVRPRIRYYRITDRRDRREEPNDANHEKHFN